jgi:2,3-bisphosphoglycerate-independent phosphoglycerate mutase
MAKKALLMILDGWGIGQHGKGDVIYNTPTPYLGPIFTQPAHTLSCRLVARTSVCLTDRWVTRRLGTSISVQVVWFIRISSRLTVLAEDNSIMKNPEVVSAFSYAKETGKNVHFMGLTSNGGVHSSLGSSVQTLRDFQRVRSEEYFVSTALWTVVIPTLRVA